VSPRRWIEFFPADSFSEKSFKGPLDRMLTDALNYIKSQFIEEKVQKFPDRAEAERRYNYPGENRGTVLRLAIP